MYLTKLGQKGKNNFEKDFYKLMNNAIFAKCEKTCSNRKNKKLFNIRTKLSYYKVYYY